MNSNKSNKSVNSSWLFLNIITLGFCNKSGWVDVDIFIEIYLSQFFFCSELCGWEDIYYKQPKN